MSGERRYGLPIAKSSLGNYSSRGKRFGEGPGATSVLAAWKHSRVESDEQGETRVPLKQAPYGKQSVGADAWSR